jgi:hypothetical protein
MMSFGFVGAVQYLSCMPTFADDGGITCVPNLERVLTLCVEPFQFVAYREGRIKGRASRAAARGANL